MGSFTLLPNNSGVSAVTYGWTASAGTLHGATSDGTDTTYVTDTTPDAVNQTKVTFELQDLSTSLPDGAAVKAVTPIIRASQASGAGQLTGYVYRDGGYFGTTYYSPETTFVPDATIRDYTLAAAPALNQPVRGGYFGDDSHWAILDALTIKLQQPGTSHAAEDHRVYQCSARVDYVDAPTAGTFQVTAADLLKTSTPKFTWTVNSPDGLPQYQFEAVIWQLKDVVAYPGGRAAFEALPDKIFSIDMLDGAGAAVVDPDTGLARKAKAWSIYQYDSMIGWQTSGLGEWVPKQPLAGSGDYVAYVRIAALYDGSSMYRSVGATSYSKVDFTMNLATPPAPSSIAAVWQCPQSAGADKNSLYRTKVTVQVPASASLNGFTGRRLVVEHKLDSEAVGTWRLMPLSTTETGLAAGTYTLYDTLAPTGRNVQYRARLEFWDATNALAGENIVLSSAQNLVRNSSFNSDTAGWVADLNSTIAMSSAGGGQVGTTAASVTSVAAGDAAIRSVADVGVTPGQVLSASAYVKSAASARSAELTVAWYNTAGTLLSSSAAVAATTTTSGWTRISAPNLTAPASANTAAVRVTFKATAAAAEVHYVDAVQLEWGTTVKAFMSPASASVELGGVSAARASAFTPSNVLCSYDNFVLRDPLLPDSAVVLRPQGDWVTRSGTAQGEFRALGNDLPVIVTDKKLADRWSIRATLYDALSAFALGTLRDGGKTLLLNTDMKDTWAWVKLGEQYDKTVARQPFRTDPNKRVEFHEFELIQTFPVAGQPFLWV